MAFQRKKQPRREPVPVSAAGVSGSARGTPASESWSCAGRKRAGGGGGPGQFQVPMKSLTTVSQATARQEAAPFKLGCFPPLH